MSINFPHPVDRHVGSRVRLRRNQVGMSQDKLGEAIGLTFQQIQKYEAGKNRIGPSRLFAIARVLGVVPAFFFEAAPGQIESGSIETGDSAAMGDFMASKDGLMIANAFVRIANPLLRAAIARFVRDAGRTPEDQL